MAVLVDPPENLLDQLKEGVKWVNEDGTLTKEARYHLETQFRFDYDMWERSGGSTDEIADATSSESFETSGLGAEFHELSDDNAQIEDLIHNDIREFEAEIKTTHCTLVNRDFADLRRGVTATLDNKADANDQIITANGDGSDITICSTIEIRYKGQRGNSVIMRNEGTTLHWHLFANGSEQFWRPR